MQWRRTHGSNTLSYRTVEATATARTRSIVTEREGLYTTIPSAELLRTIIGTPPHSSAGKPVFPFTK